MSALSAKPIKQPTPGGTERKYLPNILDYFDNPTYHFRLYMLNMEDIKGKRYNSTEQTLIAESGVTAEISIMDVSYESHLAISPRYSSGTSVNFEITLKEPYGATLLDKMMKYSENNGIPDFTKIPYILELSFKAYDNEHWEESDVLRDKIWRWKLLFAKVDIAISGSGTVYTIKAQAYNDFANADSFGVIQEAITLTASTVGGFGNELAKILNKPMEGENQAEKNIWNFYFEPKIEASPIRATQGSSADGATFTSAKDDPKAVQIQFSVGTSILRAIEIVLANCEYIQEIAAGKDQQDETDNKTRPKFLFRVFNDADIVGYSKTRKDYIYEFSFYAKEYFVTNVGMETADKKDSVGILKNIFQHGTLKKRYDYIFTGVNDQVYDFDMKFDMSFFYSVPKQNGSQTNSNASPTSSAGGSTGEDQVIQKADQKTSSNAIKANTGTEDGDGVSVATRSQAVSSGQSGGTQANGNPGLSVVSALFGQAQTSDMAKVNIDIKGDPYWLEPRPVKTGVNSPLDNFVKLIDEGKDDDFSVYTKSGYVYVYFRANNPVLDVIFDGKINKESMISGLYYIFKIRHTFYNGVFKQTLELHRNFDIKMNADVLQLLRE